MRDDYGPKTSVDHRLLYDFFGISLTHIRFLQSPPFLLLTYICVLNFYW